MTMLFYGGNVITPRRVIRDGAVLVDGSRIAAVGAISDLRDDLSIDARLDVDGRIIAPGFIDLQLNGANGRLLTGDPTVETVMAMAQVLPQFGCTSVLPTAITAPIDRLKAAARAVNEARAREPSGARILGLHLEGPFINPDRSGAHHKPDIIPPSAEVLDELWNAGAGSLKLLTLAPELDGAASVIEAARAHEIRVALGHTNATPSQIDRAISLGACLATHLFNAMAQLGSRQPGTVGGVLANDQIFASVIVDGIHVDPVSLLIAARAKGADRVVLITDGMPPIGTHETTFLLDGETITVRDGACYRPDGVLAGSALTMDRAVHNMHHVVGAPLQDAIGMATLNPASVIGLADNKGSIERGKDADLIVIDRDVNVYLTMVEGQIRYRHFSLA